MDGWLFFLQNVFYRLVGIGTILSENGKLKGHHAKPTKKMPTSQGDVTTMPQVWWTHYAPFEIEDVFLVTENWKDASLHGN